MPRATNFSISDRISTQEAPSGSHLAAPPLLSMDAWEQEDPEAYRTLARPRAAAFELPAMDEDIDEAEVTDLEGLIEALGAELLDEDEKIEILPMLDDEHLAPVSEDADTLPAFDFREMARIIEERERMERESLSLVVVDPTELPPAPRQLHLPAPANRRPANGAARGPAARIQRRIWMAEMDRAAS